MKLWFKVLLSTVLACALCALFASPAFAGPAITITGPSTPATFMQGSSTTVSWSMSSAVSSGTFRVWLKNTISGAWVRITPAAGPVAALPGATSYSVPWLVAQPVGSYVLWIYYYAPDGSTVLASASSSGIVSVL